MSLCANPEQHSDAEFHALLDRIAALEAALEKHGWHDDECAHYDGETCTCGFDQALAGDKKGV